MGQVFLGRSPGGRPVAVKFIQAEFLKARPEFRIRFAREVEAARRVNALFTAPVVNADTDAETPWLATAYVPGPSLEAAVDDHGPLRPTVVRALAAGLAEGLAAIHAAGVVHRDLKPSNVLLASDGPRIIDFGISRAADLSALTQVDQFLGSPAFMSPEHAEGREIGPASDVFSLGSVLTFAANGNGPFNGESVPALFYQVVNADPELGNLSGRLRSLVERCLAKNPADRPTPDQIVTELGSTGLLHDWLPAAVAATLVRYDVRESNRTGQPPTPQRPPPQPPPQIRQPPIRQPALSPYPVPAQSPYLRPPNYFQPAAARRPQPAVRRVVSGPLPVEYRFGWLGLPLVLFCLVATFVLPLETFYTLAFGFAATIVVSRLAALALLIRSHRTSGLASRALRCLISDVAGAAGLVVIFFGGVLFSVEVLLPVVGPGPGEDYRQALQAGGPANPFSTPQQGAYTLHLYLLLSVLVVTAIVLLRTRANLERPLVLPRAARLLNARPAPIRLAAASAVIALAVALIALNGGVSPGTLPSGRICAIAPFTCHSVKTLHFPHRH
jgi:serine/threonine protein kinase